MGVLSNLEPQNVFHFFEEITKIPHGSGNVGQISDYLVKFARDRGLCCIQDELKNIIIVKEAVPGYEDEPTVILQGHMDMVAVKKPDCDIDMAKEGLRIAVRGDEIYAQGTSLGGDDGIAVAYALALLDSDTIKHPRLEVIVTVDEEVGMDGARGIDLSMLTGNRMVNLDSEDEGIFLTSCAGGARVKGKLPLSEAQRQGVAVEVTVGGLLGGHSGGEIHKERGNSNCLMGRLLYRLGGNVRYRYLTAAGRPGGQCHPQGDESRTGGGGAGQRGDPGRGEDSGGRDSGGAFLQGSRGIPGSGRGQARKLAVHHGGGYGKSGGLADRPAERRAGHERGHARAGGDLPEPGHPEL